MDVELFEKAKELLSSMKYVEDKIKTVEEIRKRHNYGVEFGFNNTCVGCFDAEDVYYFCDYLIDKYNKQLDEIKNEFQNL